MMAIRASVEDFFFWFVDCVFVLFSVCWEMEPYSKTTRASFFFPSFLEWLVGSVRMKEKQSRTAKGLCTSWQMLQAV
jgi:hypothetical protein